MKDRIEKSMGKDGLMQERQEGSKGKRERGLAFNRVKGRKQSAWLSRWDVASVKSKTEVIEQ